MIIDVHGHIGRLLKDRREFVDVDNLIAKMDAWGIDRTCVLALSEHPEGAYMECDTKDVLTACECRPDRLIPFCLIDPRHGNNADMDFRYLFEEYAARGCKGLGEFLPKLDFDDPRCLNLYRQAGEFKMPVLFDMQDSKNGYGLRDSYGLPRLERALQSCPDTVFIGHGPTFWAEISGEVPESTRAGYPAGPVKPGGAVPRLMQRYSNLWADTSANSGYNALTRDMAFGLEFFDQFQDKLMFGTDSCKRSDVNIIPPIVALIRQLRESGELKADIIDKITWKNAARLLDIRTRENL